MELRRNFDKAEDGVVRRKVIALIGSIVSVIILAQLAWQLSLAGQPNLIEVKMLDRNTFIIQGSTTNYEEFASILKKVVIDSKKEYPNNQIQLTLPSSATQSKQITDIIMIVTAMDLDWEIKQQ
jgi:hypothetical protein